MVASRLGWIFIHGDSILRTSRIHHTVYTAHRRTFLWRRGTKRKNVTARCRRRFRSTHQMQVEPVQNINVHAKCMSYNQWLSVACCGGGTEKDACQWLIPSLDNKIHMLRIRLMKALVWYDTIRDAILTCARKPTWIGLIYRTETTTKNCKNWKVKADMLVVTVKSGESCSSFWKKKKKKGCSGKDLQKKVLSLEWKREWVMKNNNN